MKRFFIISILLISIVLPSKAAYILIPMDNTQTNHLKAYGVAYWVLQREVEISWLLNYKGGSYLIPYHEMFERECKMRSVSYQVIADAQADAILAEIADPGVNMDEMKLQKVPRIAVYAPKNNLPWDDAVTMVLTYAGCFGLAELFLGLPVLRAVVNAFASLGLRYDSPASGRRVGHLRRLTVWFFLIRTANSILPELVYLRSTEYLGNVVYGVVIDIRDYRPYLIIFFATIAGIVGLPGNCDYSASKGAISLFTKTLAMETAQRGITVNAIAPGFIFTKLSDRYSPHDLAGFRHKIPVGHGGTVDDITPMILFLADLEKSKFIVGETIFIDGGQSIDGTIESIEYDLPNE